MSVDSLLHSLSKFKIRKSKKERKEREKRMGDYLEFFSHKEKCVVLVEALSFECIEFFLHLLRRLPALVSSSFALSPLLSR